MSSILERADAMVVEDTRRWLQHAVIGLGLRVAREHEFSPVGGGQQHINHLYRLEGLDHFFLGLAQSEHQT